MANIPINNGRMAPGHWLPSYLLSSNPHRAPSRQTAAVDELSSDSEEESEEDYELADAILASEIDYLNQEGYHAPVAQPITETQEYNRPSGSSRQPVETASYAQNLPATRHHYGSNEDVYNPYSPFTSKEYIEQEVAAGRMAVEDPNNKANHDSETSSQSIEGLQAAVQPTNRALNRAALRASQSRETAGRRNELDPSANLIGPAEFRSRMMRTLRIPYGQHAATPTPDSSNAPVLAAAPAPVNLSNTACTNSRHRRRGDTVVTSPRRRNGLMAMMRTPRNARAASSASTDAATPTLESQSSVARKRRRADRSPEDAVPIPFPPPRAPSAVGNRVAGSSARRASTGASGSLGLVRSDSELPGLTDRSSQRNHNPVGFDVDTQRLLLRLPDDIKHRILEYVLGINMGLPPPQGRRSLLPPRKDNTGRADFLFTSELMPRTFEAGKRKALLDIFRNRAPYVPAAIGKRIGQPTIQYHVTNGRPPNGGLPYMPHPVSSGEQGWPSNVLPTEVFQNIAGNLSRDDIQQMRLVNHEFELKVSNLLFRRVVVPFRPEIYGLIVQKDKPMEIIDFKGKGKAKNFPLNEDTTVKDVHDGMKVFQAWGPHINQFAMAFEIDEDQLTRPPQKAEYEWFTTFWGPMKWPHPYYNRFEICAQLEKKADEYRCMGMALSNLKEAKDLGLSIDSGLGWLVGPDISDRAQLFKDKSQVFGRQLIADSKQEERNRNWHDMVRTLGFKNSEYAVPKNTMIPLGGQRLTANALGAYELHLWDPCGQGWSIGEDGELHTPSQLIEFVGKPLRAGRRITKMRPLVFQGVNLAGPANGDLDATSTINILDLSQGHKDTWAKTTKLKPNDLVAAQKELLLETEWAQRAFLSSYCMALTDNTETFQHVRTLTIAKLSSRYLEALQRDDFWMALPQLNALTFHVSPDFRDIQKADTGMVVILDLDPSEAAAKFYILLLKCIAPVPNIKTMDLGYTGGGEQQIGIFGRNRHILPAPFTNYAPRIINGAGGQAIGVSGIVKQNPEDILALPYVEHLTLTNCWIAPPTLKDFVTKLRAPRMQTLTLDSVSLTAHSGFVMDPNEPNPMDQPGFTQLPDGTPRLFDAIVGNLHQQRRKVPNPDYSNGGSWITNGGRIGSWRNVIDTITPGPTIDLLRWVYQHSDDFPRSRQVGALQRINFNSCGYVRLTPYSHNFDQEALGNTVNSPPVCLQKRALDLMPVMMSRNHDMLLGQIVPSLSAEELEVFKFAFPMRLGWDDQEAAEHVLEDGQPKGGSGRFSGHVEKLIFPESSGS